MSQVKPEIINVEEMNKSCNNCGKLQETKDACKKCLYGSLKTKIEIEQKRISEYEKRQKDE